MLEVILHSLMISFLVVQITYFLYRVLPVIRYKDPFYKQKPHKSKTFFLTCIKNEAHQLAEFLQSLKKQTLDQSEIYIIDDHSTDDQYQRSKEIVDSFDDVYLFQSTSDPGKKHAQEFGFGLIEDANIILLDADCRPSSVEWAERNITTLKKKALVISYGPFYKESSWLNRFIRFDCMWIAGQYLSAAVQGAAYMAVGRNMSLKKKVFLETKDKIQGKNIISGDDDLLVQAIEDKENIGVLVSPSSFVYSSAERSYPDFLRQKSRQISTSFHYSMRDQFLLSLSGLLSIMYPILFIAAGFLLSFSSFIVYCVIKLIVSALFLFELAKKLEEKDLIPQLLVLEFVYGLHLIILAFFSMISPKNRWK